MTGLGYSGGYVTGYGVAGADPVVSAPITVAIDWNKDGNYTDPDEDVTNLVRPISAPISVQYGRDQSSALAPTVSGQGSMVLDNRDRRFSPRNTASPLHGKVKPARPVRITRQVGGNTYTLWQGFTDDSPINPDLNSRTVAVSMVDALAILRGQKISTELFRDLRTGDVIHRILDACGWAGGRDLDAGATVIPWWWEDGTDALEAIERVVRSEGPPALFTVGAGGEVIFRDRHHRLTRSDSLNSQSVWRPNGSVEPVMQTPFTYDEGWRTIVNTGTASVDHRAPQDGQVVWSSDATISLAPDQTQMVTASGSDPFYNAVKPVEDTDYTVLKGSVDVVLLRTSGASVTMSVTAVGGAAIVSGLQLRAQPVPVVTATQVSVEDAASVADFGPRSFPGDLPWCGAGDVEAVLSLAVAQRAQPLPIVSARFVVGRNLARVSAILSRDLSDRVTVEEAETALSDDFYIESIAHDLTGEDDHAVTFGLEAAPVAPGNVLRFDQGGFGAAFSSGVDEASTVFRFDGSAGHRFDSSVFAT